MRTPQPGDWFTWGTRNQWFRFDRKEGGMWYYTHYARTRPGAVEEMAGSWPGEPLVEGLLVLPPRSPNLPRHIRTHVPLQPDFERLRDRIHAALVEPHQPF
jgi:hypothetical protein